MPKYWMPTMAGVHVIVLQYIEEPGCARQVVGAFSYWLQPNQEVTCVEQVVGAFSYRLQPGATLAPPGSGLDPLASRRPSTRAYALTWSASSCRTLRLHPPLSRSIQQQMSSAVQQETGSPTLPAPWLAAAQSTLAQWRAPQQGAPQPAAAWSMGSMGLAQQVMFQVTARPCGLAGTAMKRGGVSHAGRKQEDGRDMPAEALSSRIRAAVDPAHRQRPVEAVPDLRSLHRLMPRLRRDAQPAAEADGGAETTSSALR